MRYLIPLLFLFSFCSAGEITYVEEDGKVGKEAIVYDDELSFKDFTNWDFRSIKKYDFTGKTIYGSTFMNEKPNSVIFTEETSDVTFVKCNLDNIVLPKKSRLIGCSQRMFKAQNDLRDWQIDKDGKPQKLISEEYWQKIGTSIDPKEIPLEEIKNDKNIPVEIILKTP